ncbi:MAG: serine/threonine protein kinase [Deltaproteobacteria bacterium]|nr:serine/threonine protein kinase [Deltaproteobacteria bacterium]MBW2531974.1 serine/threonine protein kinase [Deltaproteobacteria bacterium]
MNGVVVTDRATKETPPRSAGPDVDESSGVRAERSAEELDGDSGAGSDAVRPGEAFARTWPVSDSESGESAAVSRADSKAPPESVADPLIGLVVADRYRIVAPLGRGGMGIVYRVEHTRIGKLLAMKLLHGELSTNKEVVRRFKHEALTVSRLSSPHTVQVFDYGVWQHLTYLVMELVEGCNLARILRREGPMSFERAGRLMVQVCSSLGEAHAKGITHRDIKPENIMVLQDEHGLEMAKVLDFGLAKLRENPELNEVTLQGAVIGTPYFISPEQVLGEEVDGRTDVYSLGAVMFRALTATYPFTASTPMGMFTKHLTHAPPSSIERAPDLSIPKGVNDLVMRCMAKKPEERFQTIERVRDGLLRELRAVGLPSNEALPLGDDGPPTDADPPPRSRGPASRRGGRDRLAQSQLATRNEVEAYERKLLRAKWGGRLLLGALVVGALAAGVVAVRMPDETFQGVETERNDRAATANPLPLGRSVAGKIGERKDAQQGDRDFYAFEIPAAEGQGHRYLSLRLASLPNMPICAMLYREGFRQPLARFRTGSPGVDLVVPSLRMTPGHYFVAVLQDLEPYGQGTTAFVHENVSDLYRLTVSLVEPGPEAEIEPNDEPKSAQAMAPGQRVEGTLAWVDDVDVLCADPGDDGTVRWTVETEGRLPGSVLEVTPLVGGETGPLVRVHDPSARPFEQARLPADVNSPWSSPPVPPRDGGRCLRLRLAIDPWTERRPGERPMPDGTPYYVELE